MVGVVYCQSWDMVRRACSVIVLTVHRPNHVLALVRETIIFIIKFQNSNNSKSQNLYRRHNLSPPSNKDTPTLPWNRIEPITRLVSTFKGQLDCSRYAIPKMVFFLVVPLFYDGYKFSFGEWTSTCTQLIWYSLKLRARNWNRITFIPWAPSPRRLQNSRLKRLFVVRKKKRVAIFLPSSFAVISRFFCSKGCRCDSICK